MGELVDKICPVCNQKYLADLSRLKFGRQTTCSKVCSYELRAANLNKTKLYRCAVCETKVRRSPAQIKSKFIFCSPTCHYQGRSLGFVKRIIKEDYNITEQGRVAWKEAGEKRKGILLKETVTWYCEICDKKCTISRGKLSPARKLRFCSNDCSNKAMMGVNNPSWRGGHPNYYGPNWRPLRRLARILDNNTCQRCSVTKKELKRELDVHHIKPVSSFKIKNDANYLENLVSLCHECHMIVEWNGVDFQLPNRCVNKGTEIKTQSVMGKRNRRHNNH